MTLLRIALTLLTAFGLTANALALEPSGQRTFDGPRHGEDRSAFNAALQRAILQSQLDKTPVRDRLTVFDHSVEFEWPVRKAVSVTAKGIEGISNFLDQDGNENSLEDWNCGGPNARTYDGHNGLDIFTSPFSWLMMEQDAGIVVAAAAGVIRDKVEDQPERSCEANDSSGDNNLIFIEHADGSLAFYAHMRTNSLTHKKVGDTVQAGDYLGVIGSAGISTGPHLHFEIGFFEGGSWVPQDPYAGACNDINDTTWWAEQPGYDDSSLLFAASHSQSPEFPPCPQNEIPHFENEFLRGDTVVLSAALRDYLQGQQVDFRLLRPDGSVQNQWSYSDSGAPRRNSWMIWYTINLSGTAMAGEWTLEVTFEGQQETHQFWVQQSPPVPGVIADTNNAYNGLWYDPSLDGEGYNIITTRSGTVVYYYGSDAGGDRLWLVSDLISQEFRENEQLTVTMYESTGGIHDRPIQSSRGLSNWGELTLTFDACRSGSANLNGMDGNKTSKLTKLAAVPGTECANEPVSATSPYSGLWYDTTLEGEGFNLVVAPAGTVLYYYGFDAAGDRLWLLSAPFEFDYAADQEITIELFKATSGTFGAPVPSNSALESWGSMTVVGMTCNRMDYLLETLEGTKAMAAQRLVGVLGLECNG